MTSLLSRALVAALASTLIGAMAVGAQPPQRGVFLSLTYDPRDMPAVAVMPLPAIVAHADSIRTILHRDLEYSDRFTMVMLRGNDPAAFRETGSRGGINYGMFKELGVRYVVEPSTGPLGLHVVLHSIDQGKVAATDDFRLATVGLGRDWRMGLHRASDAVQEWITGQPGIAATRITYMRGNSIRVIDSDGAMEITVPTEANGISPAWDRTGDRIAYSTYGPDSRVLIVDLATGRPRVIAGPTRNTGYATPVFSPDGASVVFSQFGERGADLWTVPTAGGTPRRLSVGRGSDNINPAFRPDGRRIAFTTTRSGHPEVYIMDADGTNPEVLVRWPDVGDDNAYRAEPDWSPDGQKIALQSRINGDYQIVTVNVSDLSRRIWTSERINEQPSWAPDSRHLVFTSTRTGVRQLWILDTQTGKSRQLTRSPGSALGSWSPRLRAP